MPPLRRPGFQAVENPAASAPRVSRNTAIVLAVVGFHVAFIWALQSGLLMRAAEIIVPAEVLAEFITPPAPQAPPTPAPTPTPKPTPQVAPTPPAPVKRAAPKAPATPALQPLAIADPTPSPTAPTGVVAQAPQAVTAPAAAAPSPAPAAPAAAGPAKVELPSLDARYSDQDATVYPAMSRRLGEEGTTVYSVLIGTDGKAISARLVKSSGFDRLDKAAYDTVMRRRYTPGTRDGVPVALSYNAPITWVLR
jgi:protein TonB